MLAILDGKTGHRGTEPTADTNERPDEHSRVSTELGREEIRPWTLDPERYVLEFDGYEVDLERMRTSAEALDWIFQVAGKAWASDKVIAGLIFRYRGPSPPSGESLLGRRVEVDDRVRDPCPRGCARHRVHGLTCAPYWVLRSSRSQSSSLSSSSRSCRRCGGCAGT